MLRVVIILFCCMYRFAVLGQNIDSILASNTTDSNKAKALCKYAFNIAERNPDSALLMAKESLKITPLTKGTSAYANSLNAIGWAYFRLGKHDSAKWYLENAKTAFHSQHNIKDEARVLINLGNVSQTEQDYQGALNQLLAAMQLIGSSEELEYALAEKVIGIIYRKQGNLVKAKLYLKKASVDLLLHKENKLYADAISSLGNVYYDLGNIDSASYCYHKALNINLVLKNLSGAAIAYEDLGGIFLSKSDKQPVPSLDSALYYYQHAYNLFCVLKDTEDIAYEKITLSEVLIRKKQYPLAQKYLLEALVTFRSEHATSNIYNALNLLSTVYNEMHDYHKAYDLLRQANVYNDTLNQQNKNKDIDNMLAKYETDTKDRTIALLNTQNALLNTKKQLAERNLYKTRITELFALIVVALSAFLTFVLMNRYRIKQKLKEMLLRNHISNDLHDDVGSSLSSILLLSNIATDANAHNPELLSKISENAREAIERISEIIWTTNPNYDDGENLRSKIMNYIVPLCQIQGIALNVNISESIKNIKFPMEMRKNIFLIIKEAINNILKHSAAQEINFILFIKGKNLIFEITDNGTGFDINNGNKGNGLETMRTRAESLGGKFLLETKPGNGTKILVTLPLPRVTYFTKKVTKHYYDNRS